MKKLMNASFVSTIIVFCTIMFFKSEYNVSIQYLFALKDEITSTIYSAYTFLLIAGVILAVLTIICIYDQFKSNDQDIELWFHFSYMVL